MTKLLTKLKQFSEKLNNWKYTLPLILVGIVSLLFVAEFVEFVSIAISVVLILIFVALCIFLSFENILSIMLALVCFNGFELEILNVRWFSFFSAVFALIASVKLITDVILKKEKLYWVPLILSLILFVFSFVRLNNLQKSIRELVFLVLIYLCFARSSKVNIYKVATTYFWGLILSLAGGVFCLVLLGVHNNFIMLPGENRFMALTGHPNHLQVLITIALSIVLLFMFKRKMRLSLSCLLFVILVVSGILTKSKTFLISLLILGIVLMAFLIVKYKKKGIIFSFAILGVGCILAIVLKDKILDILDRFFKYNYDNFLDEITTGRWSIWKQHLAEWDNSLLTILFGCKSVPDYFINKEAHNVYITLLYNYGLIGCLIILGLIITYLVKVINKKSRFKIINILPLFILMFLSCGESLLDWSWLFIWIMCFMFLFESEKKECEYVLKNDICIKVIFDKGNEQSIKKENIMNRLKFLKFKDLLSIIPMCITFIPAMITKIFVRDFWLICEDKNEARDNGYWLFKYIREKQPKQKVAYAINKKALDYNKVKDIGKVIQYGSLSHWFWYFVADKNVSSQKGGKPNAAICYLLEVVLKLRKNNRIFLQHGVIKDDMPWLYFSQTNMRMFTTSTYQEYEYVNSVYGYPEGYVQLLGLPRFDNLNNENLKKDQILVMPTWRNWIAREVECEKYEGTKIFTETGYYKAWNAFLNSEKLHKWLEENNKTILFYPHRNMQKYIEHFSTNSNRITIANSKEYDVQTLLNESSILITDYSSVYWDFAYLGKPIIYYQFDEEKFRLGQYPEGYFDYHNNDVGVWTDKLDGVIKNLTKIINSKKQNVCNPKKYFKYLDNNNCERNYFAIKNIAKKGKNNER